MSLKERVLAYLYVFALSLWAVAIPQGENFFFEYPSPKQEVSYGSEDSLDQLDFFIFAGQNNNKRMLNQWGYGLDKIDHFFNTPLFQDLYWRSFGANVLSCLEVVNVRFRTTDIIFPFHFFW